MQNEYEITEIWLPAAWECHANGGLLEVRGGAKVAE